MDLPKSVTEYNQCSLGEAPFDSILQNNVPAKLIDCNFGAATQRWTLKYLVDRIGPGQPVVIHKSSKAELSFIEKNFRYLPTTFEEFAKQLTDRPTHSSDTESHVYLRHTAVKSASSKHIQPARIEQDFPNLASDLRPPQFLPYPGNNNEHLYHSSVLRIASEQIQVWTHFDLYDNVLVQCVGSKRVILVPPKDTKYMYVEGDKSRLNQFDCWTTMLSEYPLAKYITCYVCQLDPGDALFIPALWWHNIRTNTTAQSTSSSTQPGYSIGFNIFWRDQALCNYTDCTPAQATTFYATNDTYGNKELTPFCFALSNLDKAISHVEKLPSKYQTFYKTLLLERLKQKLFPLATIHHPPDGGHGDNQA